jgi:hypothetical protein
MNVVRPLVILSLTVMPGLQAQQHQHPATVAPPATLTSGLGRLHHAIATQNADAQRFLIRLTCLRLQPRRGHPLVSSRRSSTFVFDAAPASGWLDPTSASTSVPSVKAAERAQRRRRPGRRAGHRAMYVEALPNGIRRSKADLKALA